MGTVLGISCNDVSSIFAAYTHSLNDHLKTCTVAGEIPLVKGWKERKFLHNGFFVHYVDLHLALRFIATSTDDPIIQRINELDSEVPSTQHTARSTQLRYPADSTQRINELGCEVPSAHSTRHTVHSRKLLGQAGHCIVALVGCASLLQELASVHWPSLCAHSMSYH
jgi:hypothetical protein